MPFYIRDLHIHGLRYPTGGTRTEEPPIENVYVRARHGYTSLLIPALGRLRQDNYK
jgi:hypothetical protein